MRTIAGAILILAAVIALCFGFMLGHANWFQHRGIPGMLEVGGVIGGLVGLGVLVWGLISERPGQP
jgi:hypothetical protein